LDNISYATATIASVPDPSTTPYMEFGLIILNIMKGEVLFHLRNPPYWVGSIKFMHVNFGHLIPRVWRTPRGVGGMSMLTMGMFRVLCIGFYLLTFCEWLLGLL